MPTVGLREEEVYQAARALTAGIPCLALFQGPHVKTERGNVYDSFADIFTVLQVVLQTCLYDLCDKRQREQPPLMAATTSGVTLAQISRGQDQGRGLTPDFDSC